MRKAPGLRASTYAETDFIAEVARRSGCGLLLDVNNVFVASTNQQWDPVAYIEGYPLTTAMLTVPKSKVVRCFSFFGVSLST